MNSIEAIDFAMGRVRNSRATISANYQATRKLSPESRERILGSLIDHDAALQRLQALREAIAIFPEEGSQALGQLLLGEQVR
jgi:hypothetical protein